MTKYQSRKLINEETWKKLEVVIEEVKHSPAGSLGEMSDWDFQDAVLYLLRI